MIQELCKKIKEKRAELGYSIEYTVERTKLHPTVIRDIEEGNLNKINPTYIKGFIKIYANFLGVEIGDALKDIGPAKVSIKQKNQNASPLPKRNIISDLFKSFKKIPPEVKKKVLITFLAIVVLFVIFNVGKFIIVKVSSFFKDKPEKVEAVADEEPLSVAKADDLSLRLTIKKKCFVRTKVDGKILFEGILRKGTVESWKGDKEIELKISDGSAVSLEVNGKAVPTLTSIPKPIKSLKITPSGISVDK